MKVKILIIVSLLSVCFLQANGYTSPKIGDSKVAVNVISALVYAPQDGKEIVEYHSDYTAPDGWYIRSHNVENLEQRGEGSHDVSLESKPKSHLKILAEYLQTQRSYTLQNKETENNLPNIPIPSPYEELMKMMDECYQKLSIKVWAKGSQINTSLIKRGVHVELVYLGSTNELKQYLKYQNIMETEKQRTVSRPIKKIHFQTFLDTIEEVSSMLIQRMGKDEDTVFDFIDQLRIFSQGNLINSIQFITANNDGSIVCIVRYDFSTFNGNTYLIRKTIHGLSDFLRSARLTIQIETKNQIMKIPHGWIPTNDNIVVVDFSKGVSRSIHYSQEGDH